MMNPLFVLPIKLLVVLASSTSGDQHFLKSLYFTDHHPIRTGDERDRQVTASPVMTKSRAPVVGNSYPENGLVKPPKRDTRALSPAGMFGGKAPDRLAGQKRRLHAPSVPMRSAPAYFLCKWGV
jgi:hypothetical protein